MSPTPFSSLPGVFYFLRYCMSLCVYYSHRGGSVLWSAGSFFGCCLEMASSPLSLLFLRSTVAGTTPEYFSSWGISGEVSVFGIVLRIFSCTDRDTGSFSAIWRDTGDAVGLMNRAVDVSCSAWDVEEGHPELRSLFSSGVGCLVSASIHLLSVFSSSFWTDPFSSMLCLHVSAAIWMKKIARWKNIFKN